MKYENTGNFTEKQIAVAKKIAKALSEATRLKLVILAKSNRIQLFKSADMAHAAELHEVSKMDYKHPIKSLDAGCINDAGADDAEYFEKGYID